MRETKGLKKSAGPICEGTLPVGNGKCTLTDWAKPKQTEGERGRERERET